MAATLADADGRAGVVAAIENQATHFDMLGLQLGYCYESSEAATSGALVDGIDPVRTYVPSSRPGARLPHGWIRRAGATCSTLDLIPLDRPVLIAGPGCETGECDLRVGVDFDDPDGWWSSTLGMPDAGALLVRPDQHIAARWATAPPPNEISGCELSPLVVSAPRRRRKVPMFRLRQRQWTRGTRTRRPVVRPRRALRRRGPHRSARRSWPATASCTRSPNAVDR